MNLTCVIFGVLLVISSTCAAPEEPSVTPISKVANPQEPVPKKTEKSDPSTTLAPEKITTSPKPSSTPASSTPEPKPTSTPAPSPSSSPSTTAAPSTTPVPTTPAPKPSPKPVPKEYFWKVPDGTGKYCILAKANIKLELTYTNNTSKEVHQTFSVPNNATSSGQCGNLDQVLELAFGNASTISFTFSKNNGSTGYGLSEVRSTISLEEDNNTISLVSDKLLAFQTQMNTSYECSWSEPSVLKENDARVNITKATLRVVLSNIQVEAFRNSTNDLFSQVYSCSMDSPDIVPIMVGIALGILVAVVLIAYLVGRRSTQAQGYLSM